MTEATDAAPAAQASPRKRAATAETKPADTASTALTAWFDGYIRDSKYSRDTHAYNRLLRSYSDLLGVIHSIDQ